MYQAIADYEKALELNPELTEAKTHLESAKAKKDQEGQEGGKRGRDRGHKDALPSPP